MFIWYKEKHEWVKEGQSNKKWIQPENRHFFHPFYKCHIMRKIWNKLMCVVCEGTFVCVRVHIPIHFIKDKKTFVSLQLFYTSFFSFFSYFLKNLFHNKYTHLCMDKHKIWPKFKITTIVTTYSGLFKL